MADVVLANSAADLTGATLAKVQNASANSKLVGSGASGSGSPYTEITLGTNLSMSGTTLNASGGGATTTSPTILGTYTASAVASLPIVTRNATGTSGAIFQSDFKTYDLIFTDIVSATDNVNLYMRFSEDGGSTYRATALDYFFHAQWVTNQPATGTYNDGSYVSTAFMIAPGVDNAGSAGLIGISGRVTIVNPTVAQLHKAFWDMNFYNNSNRSESEHGMGWFNRANAVNAVQILFSSGNITSGSVTVIGIP